VWGAAIAASLICCGSASAQLFGPSSREQAAYAEWRRFSQSEINCVEQALRAQRSNLRAAIQRGIGPNHASMASVRATCGPNGARTAGNQPGNQTRQAQSPAQMRPGGPVFASTDEQNEDATNAAQRRAAEKAAEKALADKVAAEIAAVKKAAAARAAAEKIAADKRAKLAAEKAEKLAAEKAAQDNSPPAGETTDIVADIAAGQKAAAAKVAAEIAAGVKAAQEQAAQDKAAQERMAEERAAADRLAAEQAATSKAAEERAAAERLAAERTAALKAADEKMAAEKLAAEQAAVMKATEDKAERLATAKFAALKAAEEKAERLVTEKLAAERGAAEKLAAERLERLAAEKLAAEKSAALKAAEEQAMRTALIEQRAAVQAKADAERRRAEELRQQTQTPRHEATTQNDTPHISSEAANAYAAADLRNSFLYGLFSGPLIFCLGGLVFMLIQRRYAAAQLKPAGAAEPTSLKAEPGAREIDLDGLVRAVVAELKRRKTRPAEPAATPRTDDSRPQ